MKSSNLLITSAGKRVALVGIFQKTLKDLGLSAKVYTTDLKPDLAPACIKSDGGFAVPRCDSEGYIRSLQDLCRELQIGIIIPTIDPELVPLSYSRRRFDELGVSLVLPDADFVRICRDKRLTMSFFERKGISVPYPIDKHHPSFPLFVKPYDKSRSVDAQVIWSEDELSKKLLDDPKMLFMEYIGNDYKEFTVDMYFSRDGHVKGIVPRERMEVRAGEINKGITRKNHIVDFMKERMGYLEGVRGCICVQLFYREADHDVKGIEINPRFGGGFPLSYYARANFAEYIVREYLMGEKIAYSEDWLDNTLMLRYDNDLIVYDAKV